MARPIQGSYCGLSLSFSTGCTVANIEAPLIPRSKTDVFPSEATTACASGSPLGSGVGSTQLKRARLIHVNPSSAAFCAHRRSEYHTWEREVLKYLPAIIRRARRTKKSLDPLGKNHDGDKADDPAKYHL